MSERVGLGGGCHWCTEGVFKSLVGVKEVKQGWIASVNKESDYSEAIQIDFDPHVIHLASLIEIHLYTHASTSNHSMRSKYRSAVYTCHEQQDLKTKNILKRLSNDFEKPLITRTYPLFFFQTVCQRKTKLLLSTA